MFLSKTSKYLDAGCWCSKTIYKGACFVFSSIQVLPEAQVNT